MAFQILHRHRQRLNSLLNLKQLILILSYLLIFIYKSCNCILADEYLYPTDINNRLKSYVFVISEGIVQSDNYKQKGYLINNQFPGPTVFVNQFDMLRVTVINLMDQPTAIHFHGLLQVCRA